MKRIIILYKRNIYGVMGTLAFHIFLVGIFLLAEMNLKREMVEEAIFIEIPIEMLKEDPVIEEADYEQVQQMTSVPSSRSNLPSAGGNLPQQAARRESFFDESYQQEIDNAKRLVSDVNQQLSKEIPDLSKIKMPEQVTDGMEPDSIKNIIYTGDSNIEYILDNRYHLRLPIPIYLTKGGGTVIVDIAVNRQGRVVSANSRRNSSITDEQIYLYATEAAKRTQFNADNTASNPQHGTIRYTFVAQ
jgi:TonB family protein